MESVTEVVPDKAVATDDRAEKSKSRDRKRDRSSDRSRRDRSADRDRRRDRSGDRRRDRDRSPDRRRRDRSADRGGRRDRDYNPYKPRDRSPDRSRRDRDRSRERSPDRSRRDRSPVRKEREKSPVIDREELRRQREIDDLTKDQRTIFVSQLTKKANEASLENFFGAIGKVKNIIMLRDKASNVHKGFAYVEMADLECIPNCLLFNNVVPDFQKFPILVKASEAEKNFLAKKDTSATTYQPGMADTTGLSKSALAGLDATGADARIYVGNIHISVDETALKTILEAFGPTESVKLHRDHLGNSKGYAFVKYVRAEHASLAAAGLQGQDLAGRSLKIGPVIDQNSAAMAAIGMAGMNANGVDASNNWKLDTDEGSAGLVLNSSSRAALMAKLGQSAGIVVPTVPTMPMALQGMPGLPVAGGIPPVGGLPSVNLMICNMFDPATETEPEWDLDIKEDMIEECSKHGQVEHVHVEKHKPGGIVLLKFANTVAAGRAAQSLNGRFFAGRMITASYIDDAVFNTLMQ
eukprot:gene8973-10593_t